MRNQGNPLTGNRVATTAVYYTKIAAVRLSEKRGRFTVSILASNGDPILHVHTTDQLSAERFIDALETMRRAAPS